MFSNLFLDIYIKGTWCIQFFKSLSMGHCKIIRGRGNQHRAIHHVILKKKKKANLNLSWQNL